MKNIIRLSTVLAFLFFASLGMATEKKDFINYLKSVENKTDQYTNDSFYEDLVLTHNTTKEKKKFKDLSEVEQQILKLSIGKMLSSQFTSVQEKWKEEELKNAEETPDSEKEASKKDIEEYCQKLLALRQKNAVKLEKFVKDLFEKHADSFTDEEKDFITKSIKSYNDKNNLIKRD